MIEVLRHEQPARPVRNRRLAPSCAALGASAHQPAWNCACNVPAPPRLQPLNQNMSLNCAATRNGIADTGT
jgi:hypothetical protein